MSRDDPTAADGYMAFLEAKIAAPPSLFAALESGAA